MSTIKLLSNDGKILEVSEYAAKKSDVIKTMSEMLGLNKGEAITVHNVNAITLKKVMDWCEWHAFDVKNEDKGDDVEVYNEMPLSQWDTDFLEVSDAELFEIILAANYLDIPVLLEMVCKKVAAMIVGNSVEAIRSKFGIESDFEAAEEEKLRMENKWAEVQDIKLFK